MGKTSRTLSSSTCQGDSSPWIPIFWGWGWGRALAPVPLPCWYSLRGRTPAYPFFRKEKIHPHVRRRDYDAECLERVLLRSHFLRGETLCHARNPPPAQTDRKHYPSLYRNPSAAQEVPRAQEGAFFFTKKAYCVNQTLCVAESWKSVQT